MAIEFPSVGFFQELADRMRKNEAEFEKLGYCDTQMGVAVTGDPKRIFALDFEVYECTGVREVDETEAAGLDFVLEAPPSLWDEMFANIRAHGAADAQHSINTLSHLGDRMVVRYEDPEGHDKFYRFMASIQAFFDLTRDLEVEVAEG